MCSSRAEGSQFAASITTLTAIAKLYLCPVC
jgi:hypothetical protein